jgi:DNA polymerase I-like protein with 3'-5' exonuclease and polymerase domains
LLGRYRYFNDVTDRDLRSAFDHVFQGTASDFLLVILRNIYRDLNFGYIVLQVFDSVMIEVPVSCVNQGVEFLKEKMTKFLKSDFAVPIEAEIKVLDRWE